MSEQAPKCPICAEHDLRDALESEGLVLSGVGALFNRDADLIRDVYEQITKYDGHTAITMIAHLINNICIFTGDHPLDVLELLRNEVNAAQAGL